MSQPRADNSEPSSSWQTAGVAVHSFPNLLQGVAQATNQLLTTGDFATSINQALATLGRVTNVDRVYIFEIHSHLDTGEPAMSQRFEWARETVTAEIGNTELQNLAFAAVNMSRWYEALYRGQSCQGLVRDLSPPERQLLEPQGILSILVVPIPVDEQLWGFIGFDDCHCEHQWSKDESAVLMTMAAMIGSRIAHRQTADALQQSQLRLEQIAAKIPGVIFQFLQRRDGSRSVLYASSGCRELYELEPEEIQADFHVLSNLIYPDDRDAYEQSVAASAATGEPWQWQGRIVTPSNQLKWIQGVSRLEQQSNGDLLWDGVLMDITERKQAEEYLRASEGRLQSFFDATFEAVIIHDRGTILDVNSATEVLYGYSRAELIGQSVLMLAAPCSQDLIRARAQIPLDLPFEAVGLKKDGTTFIGEVSAKSISYQGQQFRVAGIRDITARKLAEDALRQSEARNSALLNALPDLIFRINREGIYLDCHAEKVSDLFVPPNELIGKKVEDILPAEVAQSCVQLIAKALSTGTLQTLEYELPINGKPHYWEARIVVCEDDEVLVIVRNITERKSAEEERLLTEERDRLLGQIALRIRRSLDLSQILQTTVAEVRQFLECDRVFITYFDGQLQSKASAESVTSNWGSILEILPENPSYVREIKTVLESGKVQIIDDTRTAEISQLRAYYLAKYQVKACLAVPITIGDKQLGVMVAHQCDRTRHWQPFEIELLRSLSTQIAIAVQQAQLYEQVQALNCNLERQVDERTQELKQKYTELQELHRIKDVFLHAVSHDLRTPVLGWLMVLNNLLNRGMGNGEWGQGGQGSGITCTLPNPQSPIPVPRSILERMIQSSDRQLRLINSLLEVHSSEIVGIVLQREPIQLGELVRILVEDFEPITAKNQAILINQVPRDLPLISADLAQLRRVFENLLTNAFFHNPPGIRITLEAQVDTQLPSHVVDRKDKGDKEAKMIRCTVTDNGVGMSQKLCDRLFQLYFRGKDAKSLPQGHRPYTGLGLGLYLCRQIITAHGGEIGVNSHQGEGTSFWFTLPTTAALM
ncbi:MAG TPA: GAF domain-containing protein [Waterburya sp.]|jgi:PAS domain S-box-containing protein